MKYRLAGGEFDQTGMRPRRRPWRSVFPGRQNTPGLPGYQNLRDDILPWAQTSFAHGQGQRVIDASDPESFRGFERSVGIDLRDTGVLRLGRALNPSGLTGASPTTIEGSAWTDGVGTSTVVNTTDRQLNADNDVILATTASLAAAGWQFDVDGYLEAEPSFLGSAMVEVASTTNVVASEIRLHNGGAIVRTAARTPGQGDLEVTFTIRIEPNDGMVEGTYRIYVWDATAGTSVAQVDNTFHRDHGHETTVTPKLTYHSVPAHDYQYRVKCLSKTSNDAGFIAVASIVEHALDPTHLTWEIKQGATVKTSGSVDLDGATATGTVITAAVVLSAAVHTMNVTWASGPRKPIVDKLILAQLSLRDPRLIELGQNDRIWLLDYASGSAPNILVWDAPNNKWTVVGSVGPSGAKGVAFAHSDAWEFLALDDKIIYRIKQPSTVAQYTAAFTDQVVGLAISGRRLQILTESQGNGTQLYEVGLEDTPVVAVPGSPVYPVGNAGVTDYVNFLSQQRIAGAGGGSVFFANQGPDCFVYRWDGATGAPMSKLPRGFRGYSIVYGNGLTWLGGMFPSVDDDGAPKMRPAVFLIDSSGVPSELDVKLYYDDDPSTEITGMQLYGSDLFVTTDVETAPETVRLWRVSLRSPVGAFLEQERQVDSYQAGGSNKGRGCAVTFGERFVIWSAGAPFREEPGHRPSGWLRSSIYSFGLTERKELQAIDVDAVIPAGTSVRIRYSIDGNEFVTVGDWTAPARKRISIPTAHVFFTSLAIETWLFTTDPDLTPEVFQVGVRGELMLVDKTWELLLDCRDERACWHLDDQQVPGSVGMAYIYALVEEGGVVEFEDFYASEDAAQAETFIVSIHNPEQISTDRGEGFLRLELSDRST